MMKGSEKRAILDREDGIAMLTVLMLTIILTVIGIAAITTTMLDMRMAGGERLRESSVNASEACISSGVQIIQQTLANAAIPAALMAANQNPAIPTPAVLTAEIMGQNDGSPDVPDGANPNPNAVLTLAQFRVTMDIDRLYAKPMAGGSLAFGAGSEGTGGAASIEVLYRIDCSAVLTSGTAQVAGRVTGVYACVATGESCQRRI